MQDFQVSWGETLPFVVQTNASDAASATLVISRPLTGFYFTKPGIFTDNGVDVSLNPEETQLPLGEYEYMLRIDYTGGRVDKFPDKSDCEDLTDFRFPTITVTESLDMPGGVS